MKKIFLLVMATVWVMQLVALPKKRNSNQFTQHQQAIAALLQPQAIDKKASKTTLGTAPWERVIAQSTRDSVEGPLTDSVNLIYSAARRSTYDYNTMIYPYNYTYNTTPMFNFKGVFTKPQVLADTYSHWAINPYTLAYGLYQTNYSVFDTANNLTNFRAVFVDSVTSHNTSYTNSFNTTNNIVAGSWFNSVSGVADSSFIQFFTYNTAYLLTEDSIYEYHLGTWHLVAKTYYTYDIANNLIQIDGYGNLTDTTFDSTLIEQMQYVNTYDGANRLLTVATNLYDGAPLSASGIDTFGYTGASTFHTSWKDYQYDNVNHYWNPIAYMTKTLNTAGYPDTVYTQSFDSIANAWIPQTLQTVSYDTFNNPITLYEYDYNFTSFPSLPNFTTVYYYQILSTLSLIYDPLTYTRACLFPVPATNQVSVSGFEVGTDKTLKISIININGQILRQETLPRQNGTIQFSVNDLLPGTYWVVLQNNNNSVLNNLMFIKQ